MPAPVTRSVHKHLRLTPDEWATVQAYMRASSAKSFSAYARHSLIQDRPVGPVLASPQRAELPAVVKDLVLQVRGISRNLNQITRKANMKHRATARQVHACLALQKQIDAHLCTIQDAVN